MKLRVQGNSIRMRITQPELARMEADGEIGDAINFSPDRKLDYRLSTNDDAAALHVEFTTGAIVISVPRDTFEQWAGSDEISIRGEQAIAADQTLSILVEKDFACLTHREGEDDSDKFPNPDAGERTC